MRPWGLLSGFCLVARWVFKPLLLSHVNATDALRHGDESIGDGTPRILCGACCGSFQAVNALSPVTIQHLKGECMCMPGVGLMSFFRYQIPKFLIKFGEIGIPVYVSMHAGQVDTLNEG